MNTRVARSAIKPAQWPFKTSLMTSAQIAKLEICYSYTVSIYIFKKYKKLCEIETVAQFHVKSQTWQP